MPGRLENGYRLLLLKISNKCSLPAFTLMVSKELLSLPITIKCDRAFTQEVRDTYMKLDHDTTRNSRNNSVEKESKIVGGW